jgi:hypothetical protein
MNEEELRVILEKYGYTLERVYRFKRHDRLRIITPNDPTLHSPLTIILTLRKHLEETPRKSLLQAILKTDDFLKEYTPEKLA